MTKSKGTTTISPRIVLSANAMTDPEKKLDIDLDFLDSKDPKAVPPKTQPSPARPVEVIPALSTSVHPWRRFWARYLDVFTFSIVFGIFLAFFLPSILDQSEVFLSMLILFIWIFAEAALLDTWGTTPGKWLLRISVQGPTGKPHFSEALNRSFAVWFRGLGFGIPLVSLFTMSAAYNRLKKEGTSSWDQDGQFVVSHGNVGFIRTSVVILVIAFLFFVLNQ